MTTPDPLDDLVMPFSVTWVPVTAGQIMRTLPDRLSSTISLPVGLMQIVVTTNLPQEIFLSLDHGPGGYHLLGSTGQGEAHRVRSSRPVMVTTLDTTANMRLTQTTALTQEQVDSGDFYASALIIPYPSKTP